MDAVCTLLPASFRRYGDVMTGTTAMEHEMKFEVDRDFDPPDLRHLIGGTERLPEQTLRTVYFDTPDRRLWARGVTLRHRTTTEAGSVEAAETWTLKLPRGSDGQMLHREELSWPGSPSAVPEPALQIIRGMQRRAELQQVAELETTRRRLLLKDPERGDTWGELDDDLVTVTGGSGQSTGFRQIEVEVGVDGAPPAAAVLSLLREAGAKPTSQSKLSIALGTPDESSDGKGKAKLRRRERISDTISAAIGSNLDRLLDHDYRLRIDPKQPEPHDVHQARVATRRLRADLKTFAPLLDPLWLAHTRDELAWIGRTLGQVRDLDVLSNNIADAADAGLRSWPGTLELMQRVLSERAGAATEIEEALASTRYTDLLDRLHAAQGSPPLLSAADTRGQRPEDKATSTLPALVGKRWRTVRRKARKAGIHTHDSELHELRKRAKSLRYAAEAATPVIGKPASRTASAAQALQDALGELRDATAAQSWLQEQSLAPDCSTPAAFAAGAIAQQLHIREDDLRRMWPIEFKKLSRKPYRSWLE